VNTGDRSCQPNEWALLLRIVGWRRMIRDDELDAAARLRDRGLIRLEIRITGMIWGEATPEGMQLGAPVLTNAQHGRTITRYWKSGGNGDEDGDRRT
jgi:hypothetical protein